MGKGAPLSNEDLEEQKKYLIDQISAGETPIYFGDYVKIKLPRIILGENPERFDGACGIVQHIDPAKDRYIIEFTDVPANEKRGFKSGATIEIGVPSALVRLSQTRSNQLLEKMLREELEAKKTS